MVIEFFGKRGSGKTTAIRGQLLDCKAPVVVVDILGNFPNLGFQTSSISECLSKIAEHLKDPKPENSIIVLSTGSPDDAVDYVCAALWEAGGGTLVLDEVDAFSLAGESNCFDDAIRYGRNRGIDILTGCRRPAEISKNITAAANKVFCFGTHEPRDVDYFKATVFGSEAERLINLPKFSGLFVDYDKGQMGDFSIDPQGQISLSNVKSL